MKFKVGDIIKPKGSSTYVRRVTEVSLSCYKNEPVNDSTPSHTLTNSKNYIENNFELLTKLEIHLLGLTDENDN